MKDASNEATPVSDNSPAPDFEAAMQQLEEMVERLEEGDLPLEEALRTFEHGIQLSRRCQKALTEAEQKIEILTREGAITPFEAARETDGSTSP